MMREPANQTQKSPNQSKDWTCVSKKLPPRFELVRIKDEFGREQFGWWAGSDWDFGNKKIKGNVTSWKKIPRGYEYE